jgi:hypothetical protein
MYKARDRGITRSQHCPDETDSGEVAGVEKEIGGKVFAAVDAQTFTDNAGTALVEKNGGVTDGGADINDSQRAGDGGVKSPDRFDETGIEART